MKGTVDKDMIIFRYPLFVLFLIFIAWFTVKRSQVNKSQSKVEEDFWRREHKANTSRKKNLETLEYLSIPFDLFPIGKYADEKFESIENDLLSLKDKRILNLTGKTATDLKFDYGVSNLFIVSEYDDNFVFMVKCLNEYGSLLYEDGHTVEAKTILEFAISSGSDIKSSYELLANIYIAENNADKIISLVEYASNLDSLMKKPILESLVQISSQNEIEETDNIQSF